MKQIALALLAVLLLSGCTPQGDRDAAALAERVIIGIGDDITPPYPTPRPAAELAAWAVESPRLPTDAEAEYTVEALSWTGHSGGEEGAQIVIRVSVHVLQTSATTVFGPTQQEGSAVRCWRLTVFGFHDHDSLLRDETECPPEPAPAQPTPVTPPAYPDDLDTLLTAALLKAYPEAAVRTAFPEDFYTISSASENGETAIALGIPAEGDCVVGIVHADGTTEITRGFDWELLQPGEIGCVPDLYFHPVITH
jgi:hypothetical protein